jgi:hypothetical protein
MWRTAVISRLASLGHDVVAMVRDVQAASRRLPSGIGIPPYPVGYGSESDALVQTLLGALIRIDQPSVELNKRGFQRAV